MNGLEQLTAGYTAALGKHLAKRSSGPDSRPALELGHKVVVLGLDTLDLARIHEQALVALKVGTKSQLKRAEAFFTEALTPIVDIRRAVRQSKTDLIRLETALGRRTDELATAKRDLKAGIVRRKRVEAALKKSDEHYTRLLKESLQLQADLRQLTHQVLAAQEEERKKISNELQDDIAQTLLGINVRLVSLKLEARNNINGLKTEISSTQELVSKVEKSVRHSARNLGKP